MECLRPAPAAGAPAGPSTLLPNRCHSLLPHNAIVQWLLGPLAADPVPPPDAAPHADYQPDGGLPVSASAIPITDGTQVFSPKTFTVGGLVGRACWLGDGRAGG